MKLKGESDNGSHWRRSTANESNEKISENGNDDDESENEVLENGLKLSDEETDEEEEPEISENARNVSEVQVIMYQKDEFVRAVKTIEKKKDVTVGMANMHIDNLKTLYYRASFVQRIVE